MKALLVIWAGVTLYALIISGIKGMVKEYGVMICFLGSAIAGALFTLPLCLIVLGFASMLHL